MLDDAAQLVDELAEIGQRIVLAESCTGGLVAAELTKIPGVSDWLCGSAVSYRSATKSKWLGVDPQILEAHSSVSSAVTSEMAKGVLERTPEASIAAAITGHLGPEAPSGLDGVVFTALAVRRDDQLEVLQVIRHRLTCEHREARQLEAAKLLLRQLIQHVRSCRSAT